MLTMVAGVSTGDYVVSPLDDWLAQELVIAWGKAEYYYKP